MIASGQTLVTPNARDDCSMRVPHAHAVERVKLVGSLSFPSAPILGEKRQAQYAIAHHGGICARLFRAQLRRQEIKSIAETSCSTTVLHQSRSSSPIT